MIPARLRAVHAWTGLRVSRPTRPPSMQSVVPVTNEASSLARNAMPAATSCGRAKRCMRQESGCNLLQLALACGGIRGVREVELGDGVSGRHVVDSNAVVDQFTGHRLGGLNHARLARIVDQCAAPATMTAVRGDIDDRSTVDLQQRKQRLCHQHGGTQIDVHHRVPRGQEVAFEPALTASTDPRAVDQDVQTIDTGSNLTRHVLHGSHVRYVALDGEPAATVGFGPSQSLPWLPVPSRSTMMTCSSPSATSRCTVARPKPLAPPVTRASFPSNRLHLDATLNTPSLQLGYRSSVSSARVVHR